LYFFPKWKLFKGINRQKKTLKKGLNLQYGNNRKETTK
jgi:hypothetical protein